MANSEQNLDTWPQIVYTQMISVDQIPETIHAVTERVNLIRSGEVSPKPVKDGILYPQIARFEYAAVKTYAPVAERFPTVESVKNDEKRHGDVLLSLLHPDH